MEEPESGTSVRNMQPGEWLKARGGSGRVSHIYSTTHMIKFPANLISTRFGKCFLQ